MDNSKPETLSANFANVREFRIGERLSHQIAQLADSAYSDLRSAVFICG